MTERDGPKFARMLRDSILRMELRPGAILDEAELATQFDVSRTPIREAIIQLIADGLVVREGRKAKVAPLDFDEVPKLYDALLISSRLVHRLAAENWSEPDLRKMEQHLLAFEASVEDGNGVLRSQANQDFHKAISKAAGNRYISEFYEQALVGTIRMARACFTGAHEFGDGEGNEELRRHLATTVDQHRQIYEAIAARDVALSDDLAVEHYRLTKQRIMKLLFERSPSLANIADLSLDRWELA